MAKEVFILNNLTLGYSLIREGREQGSKPHGTQERRGPQEEVGQEGIRQQDAGMGQARRQTEGQWQSKTEDEVNRGNLQAWGSVLVQVYRAGPVRCGSPRSREMTKWLGRWKRHTVPRWLRGRSGFGRRRGRRRYGRSEARRKNLRLRGDSASEGPPGRRTNRELQVLRRLPHLAVESGFVDQVPKRMLSGERHREFVLSPEEESRYLAAAHVPLVSVATVLADTECVRRNAIASDGNM